MKVAPSVLAADLADLRSALADLEATGCDYVHFDVMDGHFVPNLTFGPDYVRHAREHCSLPFDVHLMVTEPGRWAESLAGLDVRILSFHLEAERFSPRLCRRIRQLGMGPALALNPQTPVAAAREVLPQLETMLVMSVDPGFAGQSFIETAWRKIEELAEIRRREGLHFAIEVDGGVCLENLERLAGLGVDIAVAGKAYFTADDRAAFVGAVHAA